MKKPKLWTLYAAYAAVVVGLSIWQIRSYYASFEPVQPYTHPGPAAERMIPAEDEPTDPETSEATEPPIVFPIDLNKADATALAQIPGIGEVTAAAIIDYRNAHGGFRNLEELLQVHGIGEGRYHDLLGYLYLEHEEPLSTDETVETNAAEQQTESPIAFPIDLNTADAEALAQIPGIGEVTAAAIIDYRNAHGGFRNREELLQVHGISEGRYHDLLGYVYLEHEEPLPTDKPEESHANEHQPEPQPETEPAEPPVINLNTATKEQLLLLPDCSEELADSILELRDKIHIFQNILEINMAEGVTTALYYSWEPYLAVNDNGDQAMTNEEDQP